MTKDIFKQPFEYLNVKTAILETGDVNSEAMTSFVSKLNPEFVIVSGTSLLSKDTIKAINRRILNIHVGITPEYRGAHGGFWALYNNEANKVGVTVHLIDTGIDTGPILAQSSVAVNRDDTLKTIVNRQQKVGVDLVIQSIKELQEGSMPSFQNRHSPSKLFYSPGLTHYLRLKRRIRKGEVKVRDHND
jgi:methionyl-tRNA formyltransferase